MTEGSSSRVAVDAGSNPPGTTTARERKKRKWDQPAESMLVAGFPIPGMVSFAGAGSLPEIGLSGVAYPLVGLMSGSLTSSIMSAPQVSPSISVVQQNAAAIVQKINQDLATKGLSQQPKIQDELIAREIVINDADPTVRYKLTKRQTQEEIQANTGAVVITRGKYRPPNGPVTNEKPLYLHISAGSHLKETAERIRAVDQAAVMVEEILKQGRQSQSASTSFSVAPATGGLATLLFSTSVFLGLEADPNLNLVSKIRGPNGQYINHIMNETGATVILRGRGSDNFEGALGEEPQQQLHLYICSDNGKSLEDAKSLAENLLETVSSEFLKSRPANYPVVPTAPVQSSVPQYPVASYAISSGGVGSYAGVYSQAVVSYTQTHSTNLDLVHSVNPYNLSSSIPQPGSANTANLMATEINKSSCTRVYNAVPPPQQLLSEVIITKPVMEKNEISSGEPSSSPADVTEEASSSMIATSLQATISSSVTSQPNLACIGVFGTSVASSNSEIFATTQPGIPLGYGQPTLGSYPVVQQTQQTQPSHMVVVSSGTSYSGYGGIYPQATPLQQVAQALQRPPPPVSVKHGTYNLMNAPTKAQSSYSNGQSEKQPARRRKFQELPMVPKDSSRDNQSSRNGTEMSEIGGLSEEFSAKQHSMLSPKSVPIASPKGMATALPRSMPPPSAKSISPLYVKSMPPPSAKCISPLYVKSMPPPSSKIMHQPQTVLKESIRKSKMEDSSHHEVSLKLVEYGEEDDDESSSPRTTKANDESSSPRTTKANDESSSPRTTKANGTQYANRKPFWAP